VNITQSKAAERFDVRYWREMPHVFMKAHWGRRYCELCLDGPLKGIHLRGLVDEDPRRYIGSMGRNYPIGRVTDHTWYRVDAWNETNNASCSYPAGDDFDSAVEQARIMRDSGDVEGRHYEHYLVTEIYEHTVCDTNYHEIGD